jgi:stage V sporulation protein G
MMITDVKIKLVPRAEEKLLAFATVTFDRCFVVRDIKVIQGKTTPFVAMPSRKVTSRCSRCATKNHIQAVFCNECGLRLPDNRSRQDDRGRAMLYADIAHPINALCREKIHFAILKEYDEELKRSKLPGYVPKDDEVGMPDPTPVHGMMAVAAEDGNGGSNRYKEVRKPAAHVAERTGNW